MMNDGSVYLIIFYEMEDKRYLCLIQESQTLWCNLHSPHFWEVL